jgi:hypothetical protein
MTTEPIGLRRLSLDVTLPDETDEAERAELAQRLYMELGQLDVDRADFADGGPAPAGSKADALTLSTILLTFSASGGVFTTIINLVHDWLLRQPQHVVVDIKIGDEQFRIEGATPEERLRLLETFVAGHSDSG